MPAFLLPLLAGLGIGTGVSTVANPALQLANQELNKLLPVQKPDLNQLINLRFRNQINDVTYFELAKTWGYDENHAAQLIQGQTVLNDANELVTLWRRKQLGETEEGNNEEFFARMEQLGIEPQVAQRVIQATEVIANPQQLIQFMVREVFTPEIAEKFGQFEEFPDDIPDNKTPILPEFKKIGISEVLARRIWAAHWDLPAINQVSNAMFRYAPDIIENAKEDLDFLGLEAADVETDFETVKTLLKTQDVMPFWRDRVFATQFNTLTRIDVRRMIRMRIFNFTQANYEYRKQGYTPKDARRLTKFGFVVESLTTWKQGIKAGSLTIEDILNEAKDWNITSTDADKDINVENSNLITSIKRALSPELAEGVEDFRKLSVSKIIRAMNLNVITTNEAVEMLKQINYSDTQAKFMVEIEKANIESKKTPTAREKQKTKGDIKKGFREGKFTFEQAVDELVEIGTNAEAANEIIEIEQLALQRKEASQNA